MSGWKKSCSRPLVSKYQLKSARTTNRGHDGCQGNGCSFPFLPDSAASRESFFSLISAHLQLRLAQTRLRSNTGEPTLLKPSGVWEQGTVLPSSKTLHNAFSIISRFHSTRPTRPAYTDGLNHANGILIGGRVFDTYSSLGISSIRASFRR